MPHAALLYFLALFSCLKICIGQQTALAVNRAILSSETDDEILLINPEANDFRSLTANSRIFVDRSLLLLDIIPTSARIQLFTAPSKWGKTVLLHMIKDFVELEFDSRGRKHSYKECFGYNVFKRGFFNNESLTVDLENPLLIYDHQYIFNRFQAKFPVIFIDFSKVTASSAEEFFDVMKQIITQIYSRYSFLGKFYEKNMNIVKRSETQRMEAGIMYKKFTKIAQGEAESQDLEQSLSFLCEALNRFLYKEIVLCIDGYDTPINDILMMKNYYDKKRSLEFYDKLLTYTLHKNHFIRKAFVSGVLRYANRPYLMFARHISFLDNKYAHFFSFAKTAVDSMLKYCQVFENKSQVERWYGGHRAHGSALTTYNPWSIVNFLIRDFNIESYQYRHFFANESVPDEFEDALCVMISNSDYVIPCLSDSSLFFEHELERLFAKNEPFKVDLMLKLLLYNGYVSTGDFSLHDNRTIPLRIPNEEGIRYWSSYLKQIWLSKFELPETTDILDYFKPLVDQLESIVVKENGKIKEFQETVENYLTELPVIKWKNPRIWTSTTWKKFIKNVIRSTLNLVTLISENFQKFNSYYPNMGSLKPDTILVFKNYLVVIEINEYERSSNISDQVKQYRDYFQNMSSTMNAVTMIGIQIMEDTRIKISHGCYKIEHR